MGKPRIILTRKWPAIVEAALAERFNVTLNKLDRPMTPLALQQALRDFDAVAPTVTDRISADMLQGRVRAKILGNFGVGFSHIDIQAAKGRGIAVTNTPGVLTDATADLAMMLLLMVARRAGEGERTLRAGQWSGWHPTHMLGTNVSGKTVGIIGMGRIGRAMARRCSDGLGMTVIFYNRSPVRDLESDATEAPTIEDVLSVSDFVSLHCPGGSANRGLIDTPRLASMKRTAFLINTARGELVEEKTLIDALRNRVIAGAGLDVYEAEPTVSKALLKMENVVVLPHLGSATMETRIAMGMRVADNLVEFFAGRTPKDLVQ